MMPLYPYSVYTVDDAFFYMNVYDAPTKCDGDSMYATPEGTQSKTERYGEEENNYSV